MASMHCAICYVFTTDIDYTIEKPCGCSHHNCRVHKDCLLFIRLTTMKWQQELSYWCSTCRTDLRQGDIDIPDGLYKLNIKGVERFNGYIKDGKHSGEVIEKDKENRIVKKMIYKYGIAHGRFKQYNYDDEKTSEGEYYCGYLHSEVKSTTLDGTYIPYTCTYKYGIKHGEENFYIREKDEDNTFTNRSIISMQYKYKKGFHFESLQYYSDPRHPIVKKHSHFIAQLLFNIDYLKRKYKVKRNKKFLKQLNVTV